MEFVVARKPRIHSPGGFYHIILRGNNRNDIFTSLDDRYFWESLITKGVQRYNHRIHAYCWMTNHVHLAIQTGSKPLGRFMAFIASNYARRFNIKYGKTGHLFERRYRAFLVQADNYLLELVRYIHLNPVRAHMVEHPAEYRWSSHRAYIKKNGPIWLTRDAVLARFGSTTRQAQKHYALFMNDPQPEFLSQSFRTGGDTDSRAIGTDEWLAEVTESSCDISPQESLDELIERTCRDYSISEDELRSSMHKHKLARIRAEIAQEAAEKGIASITEVARRFNRSQPTLSRSIARMNRTAKGL
jgi:putative transposase